MTDPGDPDAPRSEAIPSWVEGLRGELRRLGRATVAAQSAAEACEERVASLVDGSDGSTGPGSGPEVESLLRSLLVVRDSLERITTSGASRRARPEPSGLRALWPRWLGAPAPGPAEERLLEAVRLVKQQLDQALESHGVILEQEVGVSVDPELHRVVEIADGSPPGHVVAIVRSGARFRRRLLREADVVVTREQP